jgi:hypothetical protein
MAVMRGLTALVIAFAAALSLILGAPTNAQACTSCPTSFQEFVQHADRIVLARYVGRSNGRFGYRVLDVLKGRSQATLRFQYDPVGTPHPPIGSRWLFSPFVAPDGQLAANAVFRVSPNGTVTPTEVGEGRIEAPNTLAGWYQTIARLPDTSTATSAEAAVSVNGSRLPPILLLISVAVLGAVATLRRLASNRVFMDAHDVETD